MLGKKVENPSCAPNENNQVVPEVLGSSTLVNMLFEAHICAIVPTLFQE